MKDIKKDFASFVNAAEESSGSSAVLAKIHQTIKAERPSLTKVSFKMAAAHTLGSLLTLMSCEQFGVQLFFKGGGLMHYFMKVSLEFCMICCGALYLFTSFLFIRALMTWDEWIFVTQRRSLSIGLLAMLTLTALNFMSHEVDFETGLLWLLGAALGGELLIWLPSKHQMRWLSRS